jgi:DNA-binding transcriptional regulator YdaS (Cro superfamily)
MQLNRNVLRAIEYVGSQKELAAKIGVTAPMVTFMKTGRQPVPLNLALRIEQATRGAVTAVELRPDLAGLLREPATRFPEVPQAMEITT